MAGVTHRAVAAEAFHEGDDAIAFAGKPVTNASLGIFSIGLGVFCAWAFGTTAWPIYVKLLLALVFLPIFVFSAVWALRNASRGGRTVVAIGKRGIFDWRLSTKWIPWNSVRRIVVMPPYGWFGISYGRYLSVEIDPDFFGNFPLNPLARIFLTTNFLYQSRIVPINSIGIHGGFEQMKHALDRFFPRWENQN